MTDRAWRIARLTLFGLGIAVASPGVSNAQAPGPESFAKAPKTPLELWDAVDYLVRTGQPGQAVPYLDAFLKSKPDDPTLLEIRDRYGAGSILKLEDYRETRAKAKPLLDLLSAATKRNATNPARVQRFIEMLSKTNEEQAYAVDRLKEAGPDAVPPLIETLQRRDLAADDRSLILANMGRLNSTALPPLVASLDAEDGEIVAEVAGILGRIGDPRALPFLTILASKPDESPRRLASRQAIARITRSSFDAQPKSPVRTLVDEARKYHLHRIGFPSDPVGFWVWDGRVPSVRVIPKTEVEAILGLKFARAALDLDPGDRKAQAVLVSLALEKAAERVGLDFPGRDPDGAFAAAMASGPAVLADVARQAMADGHGELAAIALIAFGRVADRDVLSNNALEPNVLVEGLSVPDRRVRFAAARALVDLAPARGFPGSSRVVPVLASFVAAQSSPRVVIIDTDISRANAVGGVFKSFGFDFTVAGSGSEGFRLAADSADVEFVLIEPTYLSGSWRLADTLTNLRADPRTAGLPILIYGPQKLGDHLGTTLEDVPRVAFVITPTSPEAFRPVLIRTLERMGVRPLSNGERDGFGRAAAALLAQIGSRPGNPFEGNVGEAEPALAIALNNPPTSLAATAALGDVPGLPAQRALADALIDPSRPVPGRLAAADQLSRSLQRFGVLLSTEQAKTLATALDSEADPSLRAALGQVVGALRPQSGPTGRRLRLYNPSSSAAAAEKP